MKKKLAALTAAMALLTGLCACGAPQEQPVTAQVFAMDTVMDLAAWGEGADTALAQAEQAIYHLESRLSRTRENSVVSRLNRAGSLSVDQDTFRLLEIALDVSRRTEGAFDITIAPVASAWGFTEDAFRVPSREELETLLTHVGPQHVHLTDQPLDDSSCPVELDPGTRIDLGGIAKGYASDAAAEIFQQNGVERGSISLGGNVYVAGTRPDGAAWQVGVQDPAGNGGDLVGTLSLTDAFAVTSGGYQRYFEQDGVRYHHIIDPATGIPAETDLLSVTVAAKRDGCTGALCDALSTALFVMGREAALDFRRTSGLDFGLVLVTEDGRVLVTEDLAEGFSQNKESGYVYETVS